MTTSFSFWPSHPIHNCKQSCDDKVPLSTPRHLLLSCHVSWRMVDPVLNVVAVHFAYNFLKENSRATTWGSHATQHLMHSDLGLIRSPVRFGKRKKVDTPNMLPTGEQLFMLRHSGSAEHSAELATTSTLRLRDLLLLYYYFPIVFQPIMEWHILQQKTRANTTTNTAGNIRWSKISVARVEREALS